MLKVKVPIIFFGTQGFSARRDGRYLVKQLIIVGVKILIVATSFTAHKSPAIRPSFKAFGH